MTKNLFLTLACCLGALFATPGCLSATTEYAFQDIGTLQTHSSGAIDLNNRGEILGWYKLEVATDESHYFLRDKEGAFFELPVFVDGVKVMWRLLTSQGVVYGVLAGATYVESTLCLWKRDSGAVSTWKLPGHICKINDVGQVLINTIKKHVGGRSFYRPAIWDNGEVVELKDLATDGLIQDSAHGSDINIHGDVVGWTCMHSIYKNKVYGQCHATKWINGEPIDLHNTVPKTNISQMTQANQINDLGEVVVDNYLIRADGTRSTDVAGMKNGLRAISAPNVTRLTKQMLDDRDSIWLRVKHLTKVNDRGNIIGGGETIYGEYHALLIYPVKAD